MVCTEQHLYYTWSQTLVRELKIILDTLELIEPYTACVKILVQPQW